MKKYKKKIILSAVIVVVLAIVFWWGGNAPGLKGPEIKENSKVFDASERKSIGKSREESKDAEDENTYREETASPTASDNTEAYESGEDMSASYEAEIKNEAAAAAHFDEAKDEQTVQGAASASAEDTPNVIEEDENICTISVKCDKILENIEYMDKSKYGLIPEDGCILPETKAIFNDGENVFNVLQRELKRAKIHLEFTYTPIFDNVYIEGINNIYEFDCGENSGWMYSVNGEFPNFGCSKYMIKKGDIIEWTYTCDLGRDVGGYYAGKGSDE